MEWQPLTGNDHTRLWEHFNRLAELALVPPVWQDLPLATPWVDYGDVYAPGAYRADRGIVQLHGMVKGGSLNQPICYLPVGYRPAAQVLVNAAAQNGSVTLYIGVDGSVTPREVSQGASLGYVSLTGLSFAAVA